MIAALARAGLSFNRPDWLTLAQNAYEFVMTHMHEKSDGLSRLTHAWRDGVRSAQDTAEDYANMADAALALYAATNHASYLQQAEDFCATLKIILVRPVWWILYDRCRRGSCFSSATPCTR